MIMEVRNLSFQYHNSRTIFSDVNFDIDQGEVLSIIGINGAGKSTLLNCLAALFSPKTGEIFLEGKPLKNMSRPDIAKVIGYVPQTHNAIYAFTVLEFVVMGRTPHIGFLSSPSKADYKIADEALEKMHISHLRDKAYTEISGGERQLALIARVIAQQPKLILLDEPTSHLDFGNQYRTVELIKELSDMGFAVIMTTHMPDHAIILDGKVGVLDRNGHLAVGTASEIMTDGNLSDLYGINVKTKFITEADRTVCVICPTENNTDCCFDKICAMANDAKNNKPREEDYDV